MTEAAGLLGISRQAVFKLIKSQRLDHVVEKGDFGAIQYKLSAAAVSAWADKKERELDHKLLSANEGPMPTTKLATNQPINQPTHQATNLPTNEPTKPAASPTPGLLERIRSEAARWKGKYEAMAESLSRERDERRAANERVGQLAYELGGAKKEVKLLEEKLALLMAPEGRKDEPRETSSGGEPPQL